MAYFKTTQSNGTSAAGYGAVPPQLSGHVYTTTGTGTSGQFLTAGTGTSTSAIWTTNTSVSNSEVMRINQTNPATIEVKGNMVINGRDLEERLDTIEKVLQIPERDVKLEKKHPKLKKMYDEYITALGKYRTFEAIKGEE
jgi:hypothetical protein